MEQNTIPLKPASSASTPTSSKGKLFSKKLLGILAILILFPTLLYVFGRSYKKYSTSKASEFTVSHTSPTHFETHFPVFGQPSIVFTKKLNVTEEELSTYFKISPSVSGKWHLEKNGQVVYFSNDKQGKDTFPQLLDYNTVYTLTIAKNIPSVDGKKLQKEQTIKFRTDAHPSFTVRAERKLVRSTINQTVTTTYWTQSSVAIDHETSQQTLVNNSYQILIETATVDQLLTYFSYTKNVYSHLYEFVPSNTSQKIAEFESTLTPMNNNTNATFQLKLPPFQKPGIYHVVLKNSIGSEDFFVSVSNFIANTFTDSTITKLWATNSQSGKKMPNIESVFYSVFETPTLLTKSSTNQDGLAESTPTTKEQETVDFVIAKNGDDMAIVEGNTRSVYGGTYISSDNTTVYSYTDRPIYKPGDTVQYKAIVRQRVNSQYTIPKGSLYLQLETPENIYGKKYQKVTLDDFGSIATTFPLPKGISDSYQSIGLFSKEKDDYIRINTLSITVNSYRKPDMEITIKEAKKEYISKDNAQATVFAKTLYGQPLTNTPFSYRVIVTDYYEVKERALENLETDSYYGTGKDLIAGSGQFDEKGKAGINYSTDLTSFEQSQKATIEITPNIGASPSIGKSTQLIHRGEFAIFFEDIKAASISGITGTILTLDHEQKRRAVPDQKLTLSLYKKPDYSKRDFVESQEITSNGSGTAPFSFQEVEKGSYEIEAKGTDKRGNIVTSRHTTYVGDEYQYTNQEQQIYTFTIDAPKKKLKPGETTTVTISTNTPSTDVFTAVLRNEDYSKNKIISSKISPAQNTIAIPITVEKDQFLPLSVYAYTVYNGRIITGSISIQIDTDVKKLQTSITLDKKTAKPRDSVTAIIKTFDASGKPVQADTSLAVIDGAIYQISQYFSTLFTTFYSPYESAPYLSMNDSTKEIYNDQLGGGGGCFLAGTQIRLANGKLKNIEAIIQKDSILTRSSENSDRLVADSVTKVYRHIVTEYITINEKLNVTPIHRIFINNHWNQAQYAKVGDYLLDESGEQILITSITHHTGNFEVFNLTTEKTHTFFANGFYVHNEKGGDAPRENFVDTAYWNPHIKTNAQGTASVTFTVPDNLTTFALSSVAHTQKSDFGTATEDLVVTKDVAIIPTNPRFFYQGDQPTISALVQNGSTIPLDIQTVLTIKDLNVLSQTDDKIAPGDFEEVLFPINIQKSVKNLTIQFDVINKSDNKTLDSVKLTLPVLPKGDISSSWMSFEGSKKLDFLFEYPEYDFNQISISTVPHLVQSLVGNNLSLYYTASSSLGQELYAYSYLLSQMEAGTIPPHIIDYPRLKSNFKNAIQQLIYQKNLIDRGTYWTPSDPSYSSEPTLLITAWIVKGLMEAEKNNQLKELGGISEIVKSAQGYVRSSSQPSFSLTRNEQLIVYWLENNYSPDETFKDQVDFLSISALKGNRGVLEEIKRAALPSASDRYVWDGFDPLMKFLPALALIEKGSVEEGNKAMKGLSITHPNSYFSDSGASFALLASVRHAMKNNISPSLDPKLSLSVNNEVVQKYGKTQVDEYYSSQYYPNLSYTVIPKNLPNGKIHLEITTDTSIPYYTTIVQTAFTVPTAEKKGIGNFFTIFQTLFDSSVTQPKELTDTFERTYYDLDTLQPVSSIPNGKSGAVVLSVKNSFQTPELSNSYSSMYSAQLIDGLSPAFMYLDQISGNSTQYQSKLDLLIQKILQGFPATQISPPTSIPSFFPEDQFSSPSGESSPSAEPPIELTRAPGISRSLVEQYTQPDPYMTLNLYTAPYISTDQAVFFNGILKTEQYQDKLYFPYVVFGISSGTYYQPKTSLVFPNLGLILKE